MQVSRQRVRNFRSMRQDAVLKHRDGTPKPKVSVRETEHPWEEPRGH